MSKIPSPFEGISAEVKRATDQVTEQALGAMDTYFDYLKKTISSSPSGGTEFDEKLKAYAERNITATCEFIRQLSRANDFQDVIRIQTKFMQSQLKEFGEQTKSSRRGIHQSGGRRGQGTLQNLCAVGDGSAASTEGMAMYGVTSPPAQNWILYG